MATPTKPGTPRGMQPPDKKPVRITVPEGKAMFGDPFFPKVPFQAIFYISAIFAVLSFWRWSALRRCRIPPTR